MTDDRDIFEVALDAAAAAFQATLNEHFGRTFDGTPEDEERILDEYRVSSETLTAGRALHLGTGMVDGRFECWLSPHAAENFAPRADAQA